MEGLLYRLAGVARRRRTAIVSVWAVLLLAGGWFSLHQSDRLSGGGWEVPGSQSARAGDLLQSFRGFTGSTFAVLVEGRSPGAAGQALARAKGSLAGFPELRLGPVIPFDGGRAVLLSVSYKGRTQEVFDVATRLRKAVVRDAPGASTRVIGEPAIWSNFQEVSKSQLAEGEAIGFPLILLILLAAFGTLVAAAAPLALGIVSVAITGAVVYGLSAAVEMSIYVTNMASMIGIGVAVDYSLFIVSRFRRELARRGDEEAALRAALATSGTAVVFSGAAVAVSLAGLFLIDVNAMRSMAVGAIVVVVVSVLASVTLLPALLSLAGRRVERLRLPVPWRTGEEGGGPFWQSWARRVMAHPVLALAAGVAFMLLLASPVLGVRTLTRGISQLPPDAEVRTATERAAALAGPGFLGPIHVIADSRPAALEIARDVARIHGVVGVSPVQEDTGARLFLTDAILAVDPESAAAQPVFDEITRTANEVADRRGAEVLVGGATAFERDIEHAVFGGLWKIMLFVLAFSYAVLFVLLRSVVLPLKAVLMNLLSVGASYGVLVAVFQWGWLDWTGFDSPGYIDTIVPALVLAVTFGLSMDYEVFLLTRIRERYAAVGSNETAVAEGLAASARIITSAALIMVAVFGAFAIAGASSLRELGVGLAVAIFLDATLVRLVIVPATMRLLGEWNWWLPRRIERLLPGGTSPPLGAEQR